MTLSGGDEAGRTCKLTIESTGSGEGQGTLTVGSFVFADRGALSGMTIRLLESISPEAKEIVPRGVTMLAYSKWLRSTPQAVALTVGHNTIKPAAEIGSYCESICKCCEKGSWLSAWCCLSCASCDYFKNPLRGVVGGPLPIAQ